MSIQIRLIQTNPPYSITATKEGLRTLRGSILAQAVDDDPECTELVLENPVLKPEHLDLIKVMCEQGDLNKAEYIHRNEESYREAAVYLNWMLLDVVSSGLIPEILAFAPYVNIYKPETYGSLLPWSIRQYHCILSKHILNMTDPSPIDTQAAMVSALYGQVKIFKLLMERGVNPKTAYIPESVIDIWYDQPLSTDDETNPRKDYQAFRLAIISYIYRGKYVGTQSLIELLLPEEGKLLQEVLELFIIHDCPSMVKMLLESTQVNPNIKVLSNEANFEDSLCPVLIFALNKRYLQLARVLVSSPRFQIRDTDREMILYDRLEHYSQEEIINLIEILRTTYHN